MEPRVAYILVVHKNAAQVGRLMRRLATERSMFLVHADRRAGSAFAGELRRALGDLADVRFLERSRCFWGGFGMVRAILAGLEDLVRDDVAFGHAVVLSGQDYPLRSPREIERFLDESMGHSFATHTVLPSPFWPGGGMARVERFHIVSYQALHLPVPWRRRIPGGLRPFGGGAWLCLARPAVEYVTDFVRRNPRVVRFFEHVLHPDELFFQTVLLNSPLAETVVDDHLRYIDWRGGAGSPAVLRTSDVGALETSGRLFARKFDDTVDGKVLDMLDERIERETVASAS